MRHCLLAGGGPLSTVVLLPTSRWSHQFHVQVLDWQKLSTYHPTHCHSLSCCSPKSSWTPVTILATVIAKGRLPTYSVKDQVQIEHCLNFGLCQTVAVTLPVKLSITNLKIKPLEKGLDCNVRYGREENASLAALSVTRSKSPRAVALPPATGTFFGQQQQQQPPTAHLYHHLPPYSSAPQRTSQRDR